MNANELKTTDGSKLDPAVVKLLRPAESWDGLDLFLPRYFYIVPSWEEARETFLAPHFKVSELMIVDCRENRCLWKTFPHYLPCSAALLALALENFRREVDAPIFIAANGGYRSPAHLFSLQDKTHCWGTAADIYRIGNTYLDHEDVIGRYARTAQSLSPAIRVKAYQPGDDHLHFELDPINVNPRASDNAE